MDPLSRELISGLRKTLVQSMGERIRQLEKFCDTLKTSHPHDRILATMEIVGQHMDQVLDSPKLSASGESLVSWLNNPITRHDTDYITAIQSLPREIKIQGSHWLLNIETTLLDLLTV
jgi:UDP-N-acetylglucosamine/UDP-N-acetylgalactosamine diphosphorylase